MAKKRAGAPPSLPGKGRWVVVNERNRVLSVHRQESPAGASADVTLPFLEVSGGARAQEAVLPVLLWLP